MSMDEAAARFLKQGNTLGARSRKPYQPLVEIITTEVLRMIDDPPTGIRCWDHTIPDDPDLGYLERTGASTAGGMHDPKAAFHWALALREHALRDNPEMFAEHRGLFAACEQMYHVAYEYALEFARKLDARTAHTLRATQLEAQMRATTEHLLRVACYKGERPDAEGAILGRGHRDRACVTFALSESDPGLYAFNPATGLYEAVGSALNTPFIMTGIKFTTFTNGLLLPTVHEIRWEGTVMLHGVVYRVSIIFFAHVSIVSPIETIVEAGHEMDLFHKVAA